MEILKRTLDVKAEHEGKVGTGVGKEAMRSLYFELGKRQADSHALSLSLAECNQTLGTYKKQLDELKIELGQSRSELNQKRTDVDVLSQQSIFDKEEIEELRSKFSSLSASYNKQKEYTQALLKELEEEKKNVEQCQNGTIEIVSSLSEELERERQEKDALLTTIESHRVNSSAPQAIAIESGATGSEIESLRVKNCNLERMVSRSPFRTDSIYFYTHLM